MSFGVAPIHAVVKIYVCIIVYIQGPLVICSYVSYLYIGSQKLSAILKEMKSPNSYYDKVEMKSYTKSAIEAPYEKCAGGVTSSNVAMEENPAYQSVDVAAT